MAAEAVQWLDPKDVDAVLERASAGRWTELALVASGQPDWGFHVMDLLRRGWSAERVFHVTEPLGHLPPLLCRLTDLVSLDLSGNGIGEAAARALSSSLPGLKWLNLMGNRLGDTGAAAITALTDLTSLDLGCNDIGDTGVKAVASLTSLTSLGLLDSRIGDEGAKAIARHLAGLSSLDLRANRIGYAGAEAIGTLTGLRSLDLAVNIIGADGARAILNAWADPATAGRRQLLDLRENGDLSELLPPEVLQQVDAQVIIAAWRQRKEQEALQEPLPPPDSAGEPVAHGIQVGTAPDGRLTLVDPALGVGARDDDVGRELHAEVIAALDRLIAKARQSNAVAEWREAAEAAKERLGDGPLEVRVSAILRIERLRSLREADDRRRLAPDPLVEPVEEELAAALDVAVKAANSYVATDPYLANRQRLLADPSLEPVLSLDEAAAVEADLDALDIADEALLTELREMRETASNGGQAGRRAQVLLDGSNWNALVEALRCVLAWMREQAKAARATAGEVAMQAKLGAMISVDEAAAALRTTSADAKLAAFVTARATGASASRIWRHAEPEIGKAVGQTVKWGMLAFVLTHLGLLPRLGGSSAEIVAALQRLWAGLN